MVFDERWFESEEGTEIKNRYFFQRGKINRLIELALDYVEVWRGEWGGLH